MPDDLEKTDANSADQAEAILRITEAISTKSPDLDLCGLELTEVPEVLRFATQLKSLNLQQNRLSHLPIWFGELNQLQSLVLLYNELKDLPESFGQLTQLRMLDISGNNLSALPENIGQCVQLEELFVSHNQLMALPESLGRLKRLKTLHACENDLRGIPVSFLQLSTLRELDLFGNRDLQIPLVATWRTSESPPGIHATDPKAILDHYFDARGTFLVFSGGGIRATLFQLGVALYLAQTGKLSKIRRVVSVSGGSILAAHLVLHWERALATAEGFDKVASELIQFVQSDIRHSIIIPWIWSRLFPLFWFMPTKTRISRLRQQYSAFYGSKNLEKLGGMSRPALAIVATDTVRQERVIFTSGELFRFPYYSEAGQQRNNYPVARCGGTPIELAVAASSCYPTFFAPIKICYRDMRVTYAEFKDTLTLNDGGVAGNLGIEALIDMRKIYWHGEGETIICNAERTVYSEPVANSFTAIKTQGTVISAAALAHIEKEFSKCSVVALAKRQAPGNSLDFETQTNVAGFRTDLDAPSWQETYALILHGFFAAASTFETKTSKRVDREEVLSHVAKVLRRAGCETDLKEPTATDLKNSYKLPLRKVVTHIFMAALTGIAIVSGITYLIIKYFLNLN